MRMSYSSKNTVITDGDRRPEEQDTQTPSTDRWRMLAKDFSLKTRHQMFSVHTTLEEFENATITGHFEFKFEEDSGGEIT